MIYEYEFRLLVHHSDPFSLLPKLSNKSHYRVLYGKPNFRFKHGHLEIKKVLQQQAVYHDGLWFRWVESKELPFQSWSKETHEKWVHLSSNFQNPFTFELRSEVILSPEAKLYAFKNDRSRGLVFEYEVGTYSKRCHRFTDIEALAARVLTPFKDAYDVLRSCYPPTPYKLVPCIRKSVKAVEKFPPRNMLIAHKYDGTFCFIYSYLDRVEIVLEGNRNQVRRGITLGNGIVFAAEFMKWSERIVLLDVYQVRGITTTHSRRNILTQFLPSLHLPTGFVIQEYVSEKDKLPPQMFKQVDGIIGHDPIRDKIYKIKLFHSLDALYWDGNFELANGEAIPCRGDVNKMENGDVYEINFDGSVIRKRRDRFVGNSETQLKRIFLLRK